MKKALIASFLLALAFGASAQDRGRIRVLEDGREYRGSALRLPAQADGLVEIKACPDCTQHSMKLTPEATFYIGKVSVPLTELRAYLTANPEIHVLVVSPIRTTTVSRIVAVSNLPR